MSQVQLTQLRNGKSRFAWYCTCGMSATGTVSSSHAGSIQQVAATHWSEPGHQPCDKETARMARRRQDREGGQSA
jgi:hypothetical protein